MHKCIHHLRPLDTAKLLGQTVKCVKLVLRSKMMVVQVHALLRSGSYCHYERVSILLLAFSI